jgi:hypothetical protein
MAHVAMDDVFTTPELRSKIVFYASLWRNPELFVTSSVMTKLCIHNLYKLMPVSHGFYADARELAEDLFARCLGSLALTRKRVNHYLATHSESEADQARAWSNDEYITLTYTSHWVTAMYDPLDLMFTCAPNRLTYHRLKRLLLYRKPQDLQEVGRLVSKHCHFCGTRCKTVTHHVNEDRSISDTRERHRMENAHAELLHPYLGTLIEMDWSIPHYNLRMQRRGVNCTCTTYRLLPTVLPHTDYRHLVTVHFYRSSGKHNVMLERDSCATRAEKQCCHFLTAAKSEPWYEPNIARLFANRPKVLFPCHHNSETRRRDVFFAATIFVERPAVDLGPDTSLAQIFERTDEEMRKLITKGRRMHAEVVRLYDCVD